MMLLLLELVNEMLTVFVLLAIKVAERAALQEQISNFLETKQEEPILTEVYQEYLETKLVDIIPNKKTKSSFMVTKSTKDLQNNCEVSTATFYNKEEVSKRECVFNIYDCGGHTEYTGCHTIFSTNRSTYVLTFDG